MAHIHHHCTIDILKYVANNGPHTSKQIAEAFLGVKYGTISAAMSRAAQEGLLKVTGREGRSYLYDVVEDWEERYDAATKPAGSPHSHRRAKVVAGDKNIMAYLQRQLEQAHADMAEAEAAYTEAKKRSSSYSDAIAALEQLEQDDG